MYKESELKKISGSNVAKFVVERFDKSLPKKTSYRGRHYFQHSRPTIPQIVSLLKNINDVVGSEKLEIPKGDEFHPIKKSNGYMLGEYPDYESVVEKARIAGFSSKSSSQSLKKIDYVNFERMGLLERYRKKSDGSFLENDFTKTKFSPSHVSVSKKGFDLINETNTLNHPIIIANAFKRVWGHEYDILYRIICELSYLTIIEYTLFVSWVEFSNIKPLNVKECIKLIKEWRHLGKNIRESIVNFLKINSLGSESKKSYDYWDWTNWQNEAASIFNILSGSGLFIFDSMKNQISFSYSQNKTFKRSNNVMKNYDDFHEITKKQKENSGFEYHHIIPFSWIEKEKDHKIIDNCRNILYLSGTSHNKIPKRNNTFVNIKDENDYLILFSENGNEIKLKKNIDIYIHESKIQEIIEYNKEALEALK